MAAAAEAAIGAGHHILRPNQAGEAEYPLRHQFRMLDAVGHPVIDLVRRQFGPLTLGTLPVGRARDLTKVELGQLLTISRDHTAASPEEPTREEPADE
jgi:hypothetical protein